MAALEAVWDDLNAQDVDSVYCLGDLVGYGPFPNEVIKFIQDKHIPTVLGCWDEGIGMEREDCGCKFITEEDAENGHAAFEWTRSEITESNRKFLSELYFGQRITDTNAGSLLLVHGSPRSTGEYLMESTHDLILFERAAAGDCGLYGGRAKKVREAITALALGAGTCATLLKVFECLRCDAF